MALIRFVPMLGILWVVYNVMMMVSDINASLSYEVFVDVVAGYTVTIVAARRDLGFGNNPDI